MADDASRNFRISYYEKVGFKNMVVNDNFLQEILKEDVINVEQLLYFCQHSAIPAMYRRHIWQLILGILPAQAQTHDYILLQEKETFEILDRALKTLENCQEFKIKDEADRFLKLYLLEKNSLELELQSEDFAKFYKLVYAVCNELFEFSSTVYRMSVKLHMFFNHENYLQLTNQYVMCIQQKLEIENTDLCEHLVKLDAFETSHFNHWFSVCFAGILHNNGSIELIWDFLVVLKPVILVYVSISVFLINNNTIANLSTKDELLNFLNLVPYSEEKSKFIVKKAIELWKKYDKGPES